MDFRAGLHNHLGQMVQDTAEVERCMSVTDPKLFSFSPDTGNDSKVQRPADAPRLQGRPPRY